VSTTRTATTSESEKPSDALKAKAPPTLEFKRLTAECGRGAFACGNGDIDSWFRNKAFKHHQDLKARVVTAHLLNNAKPVGFYAMTIRLEKDDQLDMPRRMLARPQSGHFTSVQLCSVAVQRSLQRQGIGTILMGAALQDFYEVAVRTGIYALTLVAVDREVAKFYERLGFVQYGNPDAMQPKMLLPADSVIETLGG
jgi:GNAT superfamily N-acetyltransferase